MADAILHWLATGVHLDAPARTFMEAQLGMAGFANLSAVDAAARLAPLLEAGPQGQDSAPSDAPESLGAPESPDIPDIQDVLEYLLYPDAALRLSVERLLASEAAEDARPASAPLAQPASLADAVLALLPQGATAVLHVPDVPGVTGDLSSSSNTTHRPATPTAPDMRDMPDRGGTSGPVRLDLPVPPWAMALLVRRLRLDRVIPRPLAVAVSGHLPEPQALAVRLALRDARFDLAEMPTESAAASPTGSPRESRPDLVLRFIRRMPPSDPGYVEALALWLDLLHDLPPGKSAHAALSARRERLSRAAREADEFTERLGRLNMEILMLQGVHAPALDAGEARRRVRLMDRMCLAVLGRPAALDLTEEGMSPKVPGVQEGHDLGAFDPATGLDDLMRLLL